MSRFKGRDFQTLRSEIINFVRERSPKNWDYSNSSDPMIRMIEAIAMMGDHLHFYIDAMRREADLATARLSSSVYSYALREGYTLLLPRSTHARVKLHSEEGEISNLTIPKFTQFDAQEFNLTFYNLTEYSFQKIYSSYENSSEQPEIELVSGTLKEISFSYSDIDMYSRYELPDSNIDCNLVELKAIYNGNEVVFRLVEDVMSELSLANCFSLEPSFVSGIERLFINFPFNYQNLFPVGTIFKFKYIITSDDTRPDTELVTSLNDNLLADIVHFGGYRSWENPESIKINYKNYVRDFSSLVTKNDFRAFVSYNINSRCEVYDIADNYSGTFSKIPERTMFILSDLDYESRELLRDNILNRCSRSDNILLIPYGKELYRIFVIVEANPVGISLDDISRNIKNDLESFYNNITETRLPTESVIYHRIHNVSDKINRVWVFIISEDDLDGIPNFPTQDILSMPEDERNVLLNNNGILKFFYELLPDISENEKDSDYLDRYSELKPNKLSVINDNGLVQSIKELSYYHKDVNTSDIIESSYTYKYPEELPYTNLSIDIRDIVVKGSSLYYDKPEIDLEPINSEEYKETHFILPSLYDVIVWSYSK